MSKLRYDEKTKAVVVTYVASGNTIAEASRVFGISEEAIRPWVRKWKKGDLSDETMHHIASQRAKVGNQLLNKTYLILDAMTPQKIAQAPLKDQAAALDITIKAIERLEKQDNRPDDADALTPEARAEAGMLIFTKIQEQIAAKKALEAENPGVEVVDAVFTPAEKIPA